jgi:tRNA A-37 threonylcarbamoyl transferase component Bud32
MAAPQITSFGFRPGQPLAKKYEVVAKLGAGWEGEVYLLREQTTGVERAAKFFFPHRNVRNKTLNFHARKLHKLRDCPAVVPYHTTEEMHYGGLDISFLVSGYVEGQMLVDFLAEQPGGRLDAFQGLHLLHALAAAVEGVHRLRDYHGDLHAANVIVRRRGLGFEVKLLDFFSWHDHPTKDNINDDLCDVIRIFYDAIGGQKHYASQPAVVKEIVCGLKKSLILKRFKTISQLREHLETMAWDPGAEAGTSSRSSGPVSSASSWKH